MDQLQEACKTADLSLRVNRQNDTWNVFRQTRGSLPPEVDFSGSKEMVMAFVVGYLRARLEGFVAIDKMKRDILEVIK